MLKEGLEQIIKSKSKTFLAFCFCFILGAGIFSLFEGKEFLFYLHILLFAILFFVIIFWSKKEYRFYCLCLLVFVLGGIRFFLTIPGKDADRIDFYNGSKKIIKGFVVREPDIGVSDARYVVRVEAIANQPVITMTKEESLSKSKIRQRSLRGVNPTQDDNQRERASGNIMIKTLIYPEYKYGDQLEVSCLLQEPTNFADSDFNYKKYLAKQDVWSTCANPQIKKVGAGKGNFFISAMLKMKSRITLQMAKLWPEPSNSLMAGILYGARSGLPDDLTTNFSRTGVTHIVAVSGYNVSIIVVVLNSILIYLGLFRKQSFWSLVFLILAFVFFTGATASVVRAGIMAVIVLLSQYLGRLSAVGRVLVYAVVVMLIFNPYLLMWDAGFQLSFLSTLGLVYLVPIFEPLTEKIKVTGTSVMLLEVFTTTMAAIMATMPLIMHQFGRFSVVAPLVNILVLWIIPWLMLFGFLSLILSLVFFPLGQLVAWVAGLGVRYVIIVVDWFGNKSWSAVDMKISLLTMIFIYLVLILFVTKKYQKVLGRQNSPH